MPRAKTHFIVFRADASIKIGSGHVMRCLTLADALAAEGCVCHFLCRDLPGNMMARIAGRGYGVTALPAPTPDEERSLKSAGPASPDASWTDVPLKDEIAQSREAITRLTPDRVIVDHYALDARWETEAVPRGIPVMAIDDLADRTHVCDILLDQNLGRSEADYDGLVPGSALRLIGPKFALLRPEFAAARPVSLARREEPHLHHVMISMGGMDADDTTSQLLDALTVMAKGAGLPEGLELSVVMGNMAPHLKSVQARAASMPCPCNVEVNVEDMAALMSSVDLAIGAAGSTSWERCCLGLPSLLLVLADNQRPNADALVNSGAAILLGDSRQEDWSMILQGHLQRDATHNRLREMSLAAAKLADGGGAARVLAQIRLRWNQMRPADLNDIDLIWNWRYGNHAERFYRSPHVPDLGAHTSWMVKALSDPLRDLRIFCHAGQPAAHIRFDIAPQDPAVAEISICLSGDLRGQGIGQRALGMAIMDPPPGVRLLHAEVHRDNVASVRIFEKLGFRQVAADGDFYRMKLRLNISRNQTAI
ncbi:UDP-2,4-diacetamido-2,4,6-trideoxy-beta-L-altropyranose hydrolase [Altererythrobacter litoralis]|uniref:UDP-2,4-diacetamido-2,4, 6-trideoxy-beta-L-altropyranose hydrolase n=1 Tax=Altererythrobacter litoralis TaxID=3113904 RepID=A0ABU7GF09_9SPHN|nr:UDP-2,4-diacetamido-2,4,6-trideoxy-beta-L-altropyranose hydrolase [Erythrobacteraceae bacterium 1XM1-14]